MKSLYRRIKRILAWLPLLWRDQDWDFCFFVAIVQFKLNRMADCIEANDIVTSAGEQAAEMREVIEHLKKFTDTMEYYPEPANLPEWRLFKHEDGGMRLHTGVESAPQEWKEYHAMIWKKEEEHWEKAWKLISEKGRGWWD